MNDHTIALLKECNSGCKMAVNSMDQIRKYITDSRLENLIDIYRGKFETVNLLDAAGVKTAASMRKSRP